MRSRQSGELVAGDPPTSWEPHQAPLQTLFFCSLPTFFPLTPAPSGAAAGQEKVVGKSQALPPLPRDLRGLLAGAGGE